MNILSRFREWRAYRKHHKFDNLIIGGSTYKKPLWWYILLFLEQRMKAEEAEIEELEAMIR